MGGGQREFAWGAHFGDHNSVIPVGLGIGKVTKLRSGIGQTLTSNLSVRYTTPALDSRCGRSLWPPIFSFPPGRTKNKPGKLLEPESTR
jgi:hypothetical protein